MKTLQTVTEGVQTTEFKTTNGKINQVQARRLKASFNEALEHAFKDLGLDTAKIDKGFIVRVPNETEGSVVVNVDAVVKPLTFDFDTEAELYAQEQKEKAERAKARKSKG